MANVDYLAKGITYHFEDSPELQKAAALAAQSVKDDYIEDSELWEAELEGVKAVVKETYEKEQKEWEAFQKMVADLEALEGGSPADVGLDGRLSENESVDYSLSFEENIDSPYIQQQIQELIPQLITDPKYLAVDYSLPFEENIDNPEIARQIQELTNQYMCNYKDLPRDCVVSIDESAVGKHGEANHDVVLTALREKLGSDVSGYSDKGSGVAQKKDILSQNAYDKIGEMLQSHDYQTFLDLRASIGKYSSNNISMIYLQKPDSKAVMSFNAWKGYDRYVNAGQQAISIWLPLKKELKTEAQVDKEIANNPWLYGDPDSSNAIKEKQKMMDEIAQNGKAEIFSGYKLGNVFDISQTLPNDPNNDRLDQIINLSRPLEGNLENYDAVVQSMRDAATILPLQINADSSQESLWDAALKYAEQVLSTTPDKVHGIKSPVPMKGEMHEIESVMAAHLICRHIGIECEGKAALKLTEALDKASDEVMIYGKRDMFARGFDRAVKLADHFNKDFDKSFGIDLEAQREALKQQIADEKAAKEEEFKAKAATRVWFGRMPAQRVEEWKKDDVGFLIAQSEKSGTFYVQVQVDGKKDYIRGENGKPLPMKEQPNRETVEQIFLEQNIVKDAQQQIAFDVTEIYQKPDASTYSLDLIGEALKEAVQRAALTSPELAKELSRFGGDAEMMLSDEDHPYEFYAQKVNDTTVTLRVTLLEQDIDANIPLNAAEQSEFSQKFAVYDGAEITAPELNVKENKKEALTLTQD